MLLFLDLTKKINYSKLSKEKKNLTKIKKDKWEINSHCLFEVLSRCYNKYNRYECQINVQQYKQNQKKNIGDI